MLSRSIFTVTSAACRPSKYGLPTVKPTLKPNPIPIINLSLGHKDSHMERLEADYWLTCLVMSGLGLESPCQRSGHMTAAHHDLRYPTVARYHPTTASASVQLLCGWFRTSCRQTLFGARVFVIVKNGGKARMLHPKIPIVVIRASAQPSEP